MILWKLLRRLLPWALGLAVATVILLLFARTVGVWMMDRAEPGTSATPPGRIVIAGGAPVHVVERGDGPVVVLLHDVPGWSGDWPERFVAALAEDRRVVAMDLAGSGFSSRPVAIGMNAWGAEALAIVKELGARDVTLVGHGFGATAALAAAVADPETVGRIVLLAPAVPVDRDAQAWRSFLPLVPGAGELMAGLSPALLYPASAPAALEAGPWWDVPGTRRCALTALRDAVRPGPLRRTMKAVRVPATVMHGTRDDVIPWDIAKRWVPSIAGVLVRLVDAGHWLASERPDVVLDEILHPTEESS